MKNTKNLSGTIKTGSNSVLITDSINPTQTKVCKFEPVLQYQNVGSANIVPCAKCGKQAWEHPIITYTEI